MSAIDPIRRSDLQPVDVTAGLNEPAPAYDKQTVDTVEPVKSTDQSAMNFDHRELTFDVDPESDRVILQVIDQKTKDVIFQQPPDRIVKLAREQRENARHYPKPNGQR
jgi:uncharacterized FlaG/YvyC family protein